MFPRCQDFIVIIIKKDKISFCNFPNTFPFVFHFYLVLDFALFQTWQDSDERFQDKIQDLIEVFSALLSLGQNIGFWQVLRERFQSGNGIPEGDMGLLDF